MSRRPRNAAGVGVSVPLGAVSRSEHAPGLVTSAERSRGAAHGRHRRSWLGLLAVGLAAMGALLVYVLAFSRVAPSPVACDDVPGFTCDVATRSDSIGPRSVTYAVTADPGAADLPVLLVIGGGPGLGAVERATAIAERLRPILGARYCLVIVDMFGAGHSSPIACPAAVAALERSVLGASAADEMIPAARRFAAVCPAEAGIAVESLARYSSAEAVEDLEAVRQQLGVGTWTVYGESYGARVAQLYAARYPARVERVVLDAPVELEPTTAAWHERARTLQRALASLFDWCRADAACSKQLSPDSAGVYRIVRNRIRSGLAGAGLGVAAFDRLVAVLVQQPAGRMDLLRLLADIRRGDPAPLRAAMAALLPGAGTATSDASFSDAAYYATQCADWRWESDDEVTRSRALLEPLAADEGLSAAFVLARDLPCAFWPRTAQESAPSPVRMAGIVLAADPDWVAPRAVADQLARLVDGPLVIVRDGPHVSLGQAGSCVDDAVAAYLLKGAGSSRLVECSVGVVAGP